MVDRRQVQAPTLGDAAYLALKDKLTRGTYRPGDKLTVRSVAETLGVSSTPARDAINRLVSEQVLIYSGPKTVIVPLLGEHELREITLIRLSLEGLAAELAVKNCDEECVIALLAIQVRINKALDEDNYSEALWNNKEFHFFVYRLSGFAHLVSLIDAQWLRVGPSFYGLYPEFAQARHGVRNHELAIEALKDRDGGALRAAFERDIRDGYRRLREALRRND